MKLTSRAPARRARDKDDAAALRASRGSAGARDGAGAGDDDAAEPPWSGGGAPDVRELLHATPARAALTLPQFVELLGHIAIGVMSHAVMLERVRAFFRWLDESEGAHQVAMTADRDAPAIRFGAPSKESLSI